MRYLNCQKAKAFKLFDDGKRPSEIYDLVKVKKHTLFYYYQLWKREREEKEKERKRIRLARERQERLERHRIQQRYNLEREYDYQKKRVRELEWQMARAADKPNNVDEVIKIGEVYSQAYDQFRELTRQLYPRYADEKSIEMVLHPKRK